MRTLVGTLPPDPEDPVPRPLSRQRTGWLQYLREVGGELRRVNPPVQAELLTYSTVVIVWVATMTALVAALDILFASGSLRLLR
jgi:preprotein translocase SecE subunit